MGAVLRHKVAAETAKSAPEAPSLSTMLLDLYVQAAEFVPPGRIDQLVEQLLDRGDAPRKESDPVRIVAEALAFALDLAVAAPSAAGSTAFDRLARSRRSAPAEEAALIEALRHSRFRLLRVEAHEADGAPRLRDLATGETVSVDSANFPRRSDGLSLAARVVRLGPGRCLFVGPVTPLDPAALAVANGFIRPDGRGLSAQRCAEALYRHVLRYGTLEIPGLNRSLDGESDLDAFPIDPSDSQLDALAYAWSELPEGTSPGPDDEQAARRMSDTGAILDALTSATMATDWGRDRLADAYCRIVLLQIDTLRLRESTGSVSYRLDAVAAAIAHGIAEGTVPPEARTLFDVLRRRAGAARSASPRAETDLDRLIQRIRALRAKTVEQGCTEQEALAAAEKVAELLDRHGLTLSELELRRQACEGVGIDTDRRRLAPIDNCVTMIAQFFDCRVWAERTPAQVLRYIFFGLPADVEAAHYLYEMVERAFATETAQFQGGQIYAGTASGHRRRATNSFQLGLARGINGKLHDLRQAREAVLRSGSGRDLIPIKTSIVEEEMAKLGLNLRAASRSSRKQVFADAYEAGHEAGKRFDYRPGLAAP